MIASVCALVSFPSLDKTSSNYQTHLIEKKGQSVHASIPVNQWRKETVKWSPYTMKDCPMLSKPWSLEKFEQRGRKALEYTWTPIEQELRNWESLLDEIIVKWENKTFAFIGDSNTEAQFTSFVCLLHVKYGTSLRPAKDKYSSQYDSNGISMVFLRSDRLVEKVNCRSSCNKYQFKRVQYSLCLSSCKQKNLVSDRVSSNIISFMNVNKPDVLIMNTGAHYTRGKHGTEHLALQLFETAVNAIIEWLTRIDWNIAVFWRLSHINLYSHGDWNTFGNCSADRPGTVVKNIHPILYERTNIQNKYVTKKFRALRDKSFKAVISVLDAYTPSYDRPDAMCGKIGTRNVWDCTHFCAPGVTDTWNILLLSLLKYDLFL